MSATQSWFGPPGSRDPRLGRLPRAARSFGLLTADLALHTGRSHDAEEPVQSGLAPAVTKLRVNPQRAVRPVTLFVDRLDGHEGHRVPRSTREPPADPGVVATPRNVEFTAHQGHESNGMVRPHEPKDYGSVIDSRTNLAAASPRNSRAISSCFPFRRSSLGPAFSAMRCPPALSPSSVLVREAQSRIELAHGPNSLPTSSRLGAGQTNLTVRRPSPAGYLFFPCAVGTPPLSDIVGCPPNRRRFSPRGLHPLFETAVETPHGPFLSTLSHEATLLPMAPARTG